MVLKVGFHCATWADQGSGPRTWWFVDLREEYHALLGNWLLRWKPRRSASKPEGDIPHEDLQTITSQVCAWISQNPVPIRPAVLTATSAAKCAHHTATAGLCSGWWRLWPLGSQTTSSTQQSSHWGLEFLSERQASRRTKGEGEGKVHWRDVGVYAGHQLHLLDDAGPVRLLGEVHRHVTPVGVDGCTTANSR